ncbi:Glycosyl transferase group 1 [Candidatus Promineifilum breve]|uniref:Glycosyl transferase group 1 n=1 Tax=Candidatus Promineifilum breve TaxID=1806508 RepID=A0A170PHA2_9CHLR|nr:glycosyltransferase family 4 protein [Candidatus Promineifilum breve]CUS04187.2 Glycosyl transferase group 1 [Candidatus Promineifilum breve]
MSGNCYFIGVSWGDTAVADHFRALGRGLAARGHQVVFLIDGRRTQDEDHHSNPAVYTWPSRRPTRPRDFIFLRSLIHRYRPDCLIANFGAVNTMILVGRALGVPVRVPWHHTASDSDQLDIDAGLSPRMLRFLRWRKRVVLTQASHVVGISAATAGDLRDVFGVPAEQTSIWPLLLADPSAGIQTAGATRDEWHILCPGRVMWLKGQDVLINALPSLVERFPRLRVSFIGSGPQLEAFATLARERGLGDGASGDGASGGRCTFIGHVRHGEVLQRMAEVALVVVPSRAEALGLVNIESLAVGTPVVASRVGGIGDAVRDGIDGLLVPPNDPAALAEAIGRLLEDSAMRQRMGHAARQGFLERFELQANIGRQVEWYEQLVAAPTARTRGHSYEGITI